MSLGPSTAPSMERALSVCQWSKLTYGDGKWKGGIPGHGESSQEGPGSAASVAWLINRGRAGQLGGHPCLSRGRSSIVVRKSLAPDCV